MKYLSVCSGIEAASVAWESLGWEALAFSEIDPFPRAVLEHHYPDVPLYGDFRGLRHRSWIVDADLLVGGTPCQAFSVAGLRGSMSDERGNLTLEFIRLANAIDDLRRAAGREPVWILWENVPGVFSTKDNAFGAFLGGLAGSASALHPPNGRVWGKSGLVAGPRRMAAWRVLDAQHFGLAQRRKRVFVLSLGGAGAWRCAEALLPLIESVSGHPPPRREARKGSASPAPRGAGTGVPDGPCWWDGGQLAQTLDAVLEKGQTMPEKNRFPAVLEPVALKASHFTRGKDGAPSDLYPPLSADADKGDQDPVVLVFDPTQVTHPENRCNPQPGDPSHPLTGEGKPPLLAVRETSIGFNWQNGAGYGAANDGLGITQDGIPPLGHSQIPAVAFQLCGDRDDPGVSSSEEVAFTLPANPMSDRGQAIASAMAVRRITPVEAERLQGLPDNWTLVPYNGKLAADGNRYKALGNSFPVTVMTYIGQRIEAVRAGSSTG